MAMKDFYLVNYSVKGIKSIEELVTLSFYKKTISKNPDTQDYNIKGIYGMNGSGKTGIITAMDVLRNLITHPGYLNNPLVQKNLEAIINKKTKELFIEVEYLVHFDDALLLYKYSVTLSKDGIGKYVISHEELSSKKATSKNAGLETVFEASDGKIVNITDDENNSINKIIMTARTTTANFLSAIRSDGWMILIKTIQRSMPY